jgi:cell division protease FtsH
MLKVYSEKTAQIIDEKVKKYLSACYEESKKMIIKHKKLIEHMAVELLKKEYITKEEFEDMIATSSKKISKKNIKA